MQKLLAKNIRGDSLGYDRHIYTNLPTKSTGTTVHYVITHIQDAVGKQEVTLEIP